MIEIILSITLGTILTLGTITSIILNKYKKEIWNNIEFKEE
jgi:hypothetical protein